MKRNYLFAAVAVPALLAAGYALAQYPIVDMAAGKVISKYQNSSCQQLWEEKMKPKTQQEQEMVQMLRGDPQIRTIFINKIAGPVVNKMFECGMIP
jgi:hypothetical protein